MPILPVKSSNIPALPARQLSVGERVQSRYYANNKNQWKLGTITKKFGNLHYQVLLDDGYTFKRHIDQLRRVDIPEKKSKKKVTFADEHPENPKLGDVVVLPQFPPGNEQSIPATLIPTPAPVQTPQLAPIQQPELNLPAAPAFTDSEIEPRRSSRTRKIPAHLSQYIVNK